MRVEPLYYQHTINNQLTGDHFMKRKELELFISMPDILGTVSLENFKKILWNKVIGFVYAEMEELKDEINPTLFYMVLEFGKLANNSPRYIRLV